MDSNALYPLESLWVHQALWDCKSGDESVRCVGLGWFALV